MISPGSVLKQLTIVFEIRATFVGSSEGLVTSQRKRAAPHDCDARICSRGRLVLSSRLLKPIINEWLARQAKLLSRMLTP